MEFLRLISLNKSRDNNSMKILFNSMNIIIKEKKIKLCILVFSLLFINISNYSLAKKINN